MASVVAGSVLSRVAFVNRCTSFMGPMANPSSKESDERLEDTCSEQNIDDDADDQAAHVMIADHRG